MGEDGAATTAIPTATGATSARPSLRASVGPPRSAAPAADAPPRPRCGLMLLGPALLAFTLLSVVAVRFVRAAWPTVAAPRLRGRGPLLAFVGNLWQVGGTISLLVFAVGAVIVLTGGLLRLLIGG